MTTPTRHSAEYWISTLDLVPHPEGGYFRETYRSSESVPASALPQRYQFERSHGSAIYFLLDGSTFSAFHRIASDEIWHFYDGGVIRLHLICETAGYRELFLGIQEDMAALPQVVIPHGTWIAAELIDASSYALTGCTVAPGFDFADFEMADPDELAGQFPDQSDVIRRLCRV